MLLNNVLIVVVNVHNLNVIFFHILILYLIHLLYILLNIIDNLKLNDDHVLLINEIHFRYYFEEKFFLENQFLKINKIKNFY
jgi:hypothetical protein